MKKWQKGLLICGSIGLLLAAGAWVFFSHVWMDGQPVNKTAEECTLESGNITSLEPLKACRNLKTLDVRGCPLEPEEVLSFMAETGCNVRWSVPLGGERFDSGSTELLCALNAGEGERLGYFPNLQKVTLTDCEDYDGLALLLEQGTGYALDYSLKLGESVIKNTDTEGVIAGAAFTELEGGLACLPALMRADLRGCDVSVEEIFALKEGFSEKDLLFCVKTEGLQGDTDAESLVLEKVPEEAVSVLGLFPNLKKADLRGCEGAQEALPLLWAAFPQVEFLYEVTLGTETLTGNEEEVTVAAGTDFEAVKGILPLMRRLKVLNLQESGYTQAQCRELAEACPEGQVYFMLAYCGAEVDTRAEELDFSGVALTAEQVEAGLFYLRNLKKLVLCNCGIENEDMGALRENYPEVEFVWTVKMGPHELRTDAVSFSTFNRSKHISPADPPAVAETKRRTYRLTTEDIQVLQYCTELEGLDLGHNDIEDISVLEHCKKLRYLILADNYVKDISVLGELPELMYVELFMNGISDLTPLSKLTKLLDLNLCNNKIEDFSPLFGLSQLERLWYWRNPGSGDARKQITAALPDCKSVYDCKGDDTGMGWREHDRYFAMRRLFLTGQE